MIQQSHLQNRLLRRLSSHDFGLLSSHLDLRDYPVPAGFAEAGERTAFVVFLESGIASIVVRSPEGQRVEGGIIGREGFIAPFAVLGADQSPHLIQAQIDATGYRIERLALIDAMDRSFVLRDMLLRFAHVAAMQATCTLLSNAVHQVDERLARWLLMCHDRGDSDDIKLTHEFLSVMLAVRRPSVTNALHVLEGNGFITSERGNVFIRNRSAMEDFASDAYGGPEAEYLRLIGSFR